jgi:hypothetical protein
LSSYIIIGFIVMSPKIKLSFISWFSDIMAPTITDTVNYCSAEDPGRVPPVQKTRADG